MFITALLLLWPVDHMNPDIADWVTKPGQVSCLSIICEKLTKEWAEVFRKLSKEEGSFWNNLDPSALFSQHLNWNLPKFLPALSYFDVEDYSWRKSLLSPSNFRNSQLVPLKLTFQFIFEVVIQFCLHSFLTLSKA